MKLPVELFVQPIDTTLSQLHSERGGVTPLTAMFRSDTYLEQVLDLGLESYREDPEPGKLDVISAGSSIGAEAYSALAYINAVAPDVGRVGLTGIDINPLLIMEARRCKYRVEPLRRRLDELTEELVGLRFTVSPHPVQPETFVVGTRQISDNNDVRFMVHDMRQPKEQVPEADIILCNNVLYHLSPEEAEAILLNMTDRLKPGGVMGIGHHPGQVRMDPNSLEGYDFPKWRVDMGEKLAALGVPPVVFSDEYQDPVPFVFRKDR